MNVCVSIHVHMYICIYTYICVYIRICVYVMYPPPLSDLAHVLSKAARGSIHGIHQRLPTLSSIHESIQPRLPESPYTHQTLLELRKSRDLASKSRNVGFMPPEQALVQEVEVGEWGGRGREEIFEDEEEAMLIEECTKPCWGGTERDRERQFREYRGGEEVGVEDERVEVNHQVGRARRSTRARGGGALVEGIYVFPWGIAGMCVCGVYVCVCVCVCVCV
jgi:hypothetical protein